MSLRDVIEALAILRGGADTMKAIRGLITGDRRKIPDPTLMPIRGLVENRLARPTPTKPAPAQPNAASGTDTREKSQDTAR